MNEATPIGAGPVPVPLARRVDEVCNRFEAAWQTGPPPALEDFLGGWAGLERPALLRELLLLDMYYRRRRGEDCRPADYTARFPDLDPAWLAFTLAEATADPLDSAGRGSPDPGDTAALPRGNAPAGPPLPGVEEAPSPSLPDRQEPTPGASGAGGPRYRALRFHAKGGLGEVHVAEDSELRRQVALKRIQDCHADSAELRQRFVREAEITARLEHPGIVPVHGLVHDAAGQPCYAMRFIEGESLHEAIESFHKADSPGRDPGARAVEFRRLLARFIAVCDTIAYAHNRGVIHRDLKPANIMLGKYGETLVVDWGLAKDLNEVERASAGEAESGSGSETLAPAAAARSDSGPFPSSQALTVKGQVVGTPAFMSPEQAAGRVDELGPASDVYSLGATLYELLTGQLPFPDAHAGTVMEKVLLGVFPRPRQVKPAVPAALEAICLKAMAWDRQARYPSPRLLADDLEHWLADEPVTAWREPWTAKARRWVGRHRLLVAGAGGAVLVASAFLIVLTVLLTAKNEQVREQRDEARKQKEVAEQNYQLAREAVDHYHTEVSESVLLDEPGLEPLRRQLLRDARAFYARFVRQRAGDPGARGELGKALFRLAQITGDIGSKGEAIDLYQRALKTLSGAGPGYAGDQAACWHHLGRLYRLTDRPDQAKAAYRKALDIWDGVVRAQPREERYLAGQARSRLGLGNVYLLSRRPDQALPEYQRALAAQKDLATAHAKVAAYRRDLAVTWGNLGMAYRTAGPPDKAEAAFRRAVDLQERLVREHPHVSKYGDDLARSYYSLGDLYDFLNQPARAQGPYQKAADRWTELARRHPTVTDFQTRQANAYCRLARAHAATRNQAKAVSAGRRALALAQQVAREHPKVPRYQADLAQVHFWLGHVYRAARRADLAKASFQKAAFLQEQLPKNPGYQSQLAKTYHDLGLLYLQGGQPQKAGETLQKAITRLEKLVAGHPLDLEFQVDLCTSRFNLGNLARAGRKLDDAVSWYTRACETLVHDGSPPPPAAQQVLRNVYWRRAEVLAELERYADALRDWDQVIALAAPAKKDWFRLDRALTLARSGRHASAVQEAGSLTDKMKRSGEALYRLACVFGRAAESAAHDKALTPEDRHASADRCGARAVALLAEAQQAGYFKATAHREKLAKDEHLAALRARPDFQKLRDALGK